MAAAPLPLVYEGAGLFRAPKGYVRRADEQFGAGEYVTMAPVEDRSSARHRAFFAQVRECWQSLPDEAAANFPTDVSLRKAALIATGWCDSETEVFRSNAEARRAADLIRRHMASDAWPKIVVNGCVLVILTAKSQAVRAMSKADFDASSDAVLRYLAEKLGVDPATVPAHEAA